MPVISVIVLLLYGPVVVSALFFFPAATTISLQGVYWQNDAPIHEPLVFFHMDHWGTICDGQPLTGLAPTAAPIQVPGRGLGAVPTTLNPPVYHSREIHTEQRGTPPKLTEF